jgi:hypothetical protein
VSKIKQLNPDDLREILVSAWHNVAGRGYLGTLEYVRLWTGQLNQNAHGLKIIILLLSQYKDGQNF